MLSRAFSLLQFWLSAGLFDIFDSVYIDTDGPATEMLNNKQSIIRVDQSGGQFCEWWKVIMDGKRQTDCEGL